VNVPRGALLALLSAALFGASTPLAKLLLRGVDPIMLAGLLYLGSGAGLLALQGVRRLRRGTGRREASLRGRQWLWLGLAILFGGILAPALLMHGLAGTSGAATALLLNLEPIFTVLLAWVVFGEGVGARIGLGMGAIAAGALALSWPGEGAAGHPVALAAIAAACLAWAIDNNLTRKVALTDPVQIAALKGSVAGVVNVAVGLSRGDAFPSALAVSGAASLGVVGYGLSLVLFVRALREVGAARTGAYFSLAPFFGSALAVLVLREHLSGPLVTAGLLMGVGVWLHLTEHHAHWHGHRELEHDHAHTHDPHHRHVHPDGDAPAPSHAHPHRHGAVIHRHPHFPDVHHHHPH
jgi:drug/metabolite transporter (DMT)-like permease